MAPRRRNGAEGAESQAIHQLGVRGRKTGVSLANIGERDEYGLQPLENVFSSPNKAAGADSDREDEEDEDDDSGSEEMELADPQSAGPGPRTLLKNRQTLIPRGKSPVKSGIKSPARRGARLSSPLGEDDATVTRRLDFAGQPRRPGRPNGANGIIEEEEDEDEEDEEDEEEESQEEDDAAAVADADAWMDAAADEPEPEPEPLEPPLDDEEEEVEDSEVEEEEIRVVRAPLKGRGRPKKSAAVETEEEEPQEPPSSQKKRGRPPKKGKQPALEDPTLNSPASNKRGRPARTSIAEEREQSEEVEEEEPRQPKRQKTQKQPAKPSKQTAPAKPVPAKPRGRPGRKPKAMAEDTGEDSGEASFMALQKGPPMPKRRGLVSVKRPDEIQQTRSGRHSYKPLHWWAGEAAIAEEERQHDMFSNRDFVLESLKEIRRVEEEDTRPSRKAPRAKGRGKAGKSRLQAVEEEKEELEEWETNPGTVVSEIIAWDPQYETHPPGDEDPVHINEEQVAISADAVQTREIRDATFKFGKTLTMPFMGAGVVDMPPGAEKRPKNSRKMHMVFFVHYGKVAVTVNEGHFRISAGGQWFVPRGNYYSILNDYDQPARIFFSQACEVASSNAETSQLMAG